MLADQLANVGAKVSDPRMVITLVRGLPKAYDNVSTLLQQADPPVSFQKARSMLTLEESRQATQASNEAQASGATLIASGNSSQNHDHHSHHENRNPQKQGTTRGGGRGGHGKGRTGSDGRDGKGRGGRGSGQQHHQQQFSPSPPWNNAQANWQYAPWAAWAPPPWVVPPCPYPTNSWARPPTGQRANQNGILGPRPQHTQHAFTANAPPSVGYAPTDVESALHTLSLHQPDDNWYMDTGATSHMTSNQGTLSSYFNLSNHHNIIVGNGSGIPIHGHGQASLPPFTLNNVLHAPNLIKNLIFVRKLTSDNFVSIEFDPFGFSVKDLRTGTTRMRCDSSGELYPFTSTASLASNPTALAAFPSTLWHARLGHPGTSILSSLKKKNFIECNRVVNSTVCSSCVLGKHVKLPFYSSTTSTSLPFDILHSEIWTFPKLSSA
ncbi:uncharacterized protein LOC110725371 [Chenopodium quinoa]|uniref:uncharacterized protein LOC110725371 n=1 Tax=Chenopodium quinoa TaxID=63459 RepID=UPI000B79043C|nr:uncharacterized protein LOC110725371 [Chenopodium quinoa]